MNKSMFFAVLVALAATSASAQQATPTPTVAITVQACPSGVAYDTATKTAWCASEAAAKFRGIDLVGTYGPWTFSSAQSALR